MRGAVVGVQVALDHHVGDRRHAAGLDRRDSRAQSARAASGYCDVVLASTSAAQQLGMANREPLADHAAHRQADPDDRAAAPFADQPRRVVDQVVHRVRARRPRRAAVAAVVVAQHRVARRRKLRGELVPHVQVQAERVAQHDRRPAVAPCTATLSCGALKVWCVATRAAAASGCGAGTQALGAQDLAGRS